MANRKTGILFDLDGVLLDTEGIYSEFWAAIDKQYPTHVVHFTDVIKGSNLATILNTYFDPSHHDDIKVMLSQFQSNMQYRFFPGAVAWLDKLRDASLPMAVVTSSDEHKMEAVYAQHPGFNDYFEAVVVGEMVTKPKPSPECFLLGARLLGVDIANCYIFEDSINGIEAAHASGAKVIGLSTTNPKELLQDKANLVIDNFEGFTIEKMRSL